MVSGCHHETGYIQAADHLAAIKITSTSILLIVLNQ
jgi:hypothetical protein